MWFVTRMYDNEIRSMIDEYVPKPQDERTSFPRSWHRNAQPFAIVMKNCRTDFLVTPRARDRQVEDFIEVKDQMRVKDQLAPLGDVDEGTIPILGAFYDTPEGKESEAIWVAQRIARKELMGVDTETFGGADLGAPFVGGEGR